MNREEALLQLASGSTHLRRRAARVLVRDAQAGDLPALRSARANEPDSYVRGSLDRAVARLTDALPTTEVPVSDETEESLRSRRQIQARAAEWIAGLLLHELASPIGLLAYAASREVPDYERSRTKGRWSWWPWPSGIHRGPHHRSSPEVSAVTSRLPMNT